MRKRKQIVTLVAIAVFLVFIVWWVRRTWLVTALIDALTEGDTVRAAELIRKGAPVHTYIKGSPTPLHYAARKNRVEFAKVLIAKRADVNSTRDGTTPLYLAVENGHLEMVRLLVEHGADVNAPCRGMSPLACALEKGHTDIADLLEKHGANE